VGSNGVTATCPAPAIDPADRQAILDQLERMLANPLFSHSKRYPNLLRYVVEHALDGNTDQVKERTLGIEVFARAADYDTNLDPVVRTTAGEIRKRIAQYYHEPGHAGELRIELPCGTYVPEFHAPAAPPTVVPAAVTGLRAWLVPVAATLLIGAVVVLAAWFKPWTPRPALDRFWAPLVDSPSPVLLCVGQPHFRTFPGDNAVRTAQAGVLDDAQEPAAAEGLVSLHDLYRMGKHYISLTDSVTLTRVAGLLEAKGKPYRIRGELSTSFADLRDGPAVLVGAFNNDWTLRLTGPLRFSFSNPRPNLYAIQDRQNPTSDAWKVDTSVAYLKLSDDYAVISRVRDANTDRVTVVAAGIAYWGTAAAGEFLSDPKYLEEVVKSAPPGWEGKNLQIVIGTKVIAGNSGPPHVLATHYW
jgi:hypothetical protein